LTSKTPTVIGLLQTMKKRFERTNNNRLRKIEWLWRVKRGTSVEGREVRGKECIKAKIQNENHASWRETLGGKSAIIKEKPRS